MNTWVNAEMYIYTCVHRYEYTYASKDNTDINTKMSAEMSAEMNTEMNPKMVQI
jgi:hypothetical protein